MSHLGFRQQVRAVRCFFIALAMVCIGIALSSVARAAGDPAQGPGGPVLVVTSSASTYGKYYAEILRAEGMNAFAVTDISSLTATQLAAYDVVILAKMPLQSTQVSMLSTWVNGGGNLIAMAPDPALGSLLGLTP